MEAHSKEVVERIRSGEYFERSRAWYQAMFIAPISERSFFLIIAGLASLVALVGFGAVMAFLPLTDRPAILIRNPRIDDTAVQLVPLREKGTSISQSMIGFFVMAYVQTREGYSADSYISSYNFVRAHSDAPTFEQYNATYNSANSSSPAAILGRNGKRLVTIRGISLGGSGDLRTASVQFTTELEGRDSSARTNWTANLQFYYTDLVVKYAVDPETGKEVLITQDPQFQVVDYALTKAY